MLIYTDHVYMLISCETSGVQNSARVHLLPSQSLPLAESLPEA